MTSMIWRSGRTNHTAVDEAEDQRSGSMISRGSRPMRIWLLYDHPVSVLARDDGQHGVALMFLLLDRMWSTERGAYPRLRPVSSPGGSRTRRPPRNEGGSWRCFDDPVVSAEVIGGILLAEVEVAGLLPPEEDLAAGIDQIDLGRLELVVVEDCSDPLFDHRAARSRRKVRARPRLEVLEDGSPNSGRR